jgi:hypothetical protein
MKSALIVLAVVLGLIVVSGLQGLATRPAQKIHYTEAQLDSLRTLGFKRYISDSVASAPARAAERALSRKYAAAIRECRAAGVCGEFRTVGNTFTEVQVGAPWYGLPYDQKVSLAIIIKQQTRLREDIGGVFFLDKYTGKTVAELNAMGFSVK